MTKTQIPPLKLWIKTDSLETKFHQSRFVFWAMIIVGTDMVEMWYLVHWYIGTLLVQVGCIAYSLSDDLLDI